MAEKSAVPPVAYVPGTEQSTIEANRVYQEALRKLNESLDLRKNRTFDPMMLAAAQGFLAPTKTGSFLESLGRVAGSVGEAQEKSIAEQQEEARQRLGVAQSGLELERLRQRERILGGAGGLPTAPGGAPGAAPAGEAPAGGLPGVAPAGGLSAAPPPGFSGVEGVPVSPPNPEIISAARYIQAAQLDPRAQAHTILKDAQEIAQKRYQTKEGGVLDLATGMFYSFPKSDLVDREINGQSYKIDGRTAALLDLYRATNDPRYWQVAERAIKGPDRPGEPAQPLRSEGERRREQAEEESRAKRIGEKSADREAAVAETDRTARQIYSIAGRVNNYLGQSQNYYGIFQRPGLMSAIGNFVSQGVQTPGGTINLPGLQQAVTQLLPNVTQRDLDNIQKSAADLAELELLFTRIFLQGQGQVTEGERRIVARIPGGVSNSPEVLRTRLNLLKQRAQYDMDIAAAWDTWEKRHPGKSFMQFERSDMYKDLKKNFEEQVAAMENRMPAVPSSQRRPAADTPVGRARARVNELLQ
jgi:hypothetical protein